MATRKGINVNTGRNISRDARAEYEDMRGVTRSGTAANASGTRSQTRQRVVPGSPEYAMRNDYYIRQWYARNAPNSDYGSDSIIDRRGYSGSAEAARRVAEADAYAQKNINRATPQERAARREAREASMPLRSNPFAENAEFAKAAGGGGRKTTGGSGG